MNTKPDEITTALWLEDELEGKEREMLDAWAAGHPELLRQREELRAWKGWMKQSLPVPVSVPHAEFFAARLSREIRVMRDEPVRTSSSDRSWRGFLMPMASAAGMAFCFWLGGRYGDGARPVVVSGPVAAAVTTPAALSPVLYTPESQMAAHAFASDGAAATVIVLDGVEALPDSFEVPDTAAHETGRNATADNLPAS